MAKGKGKTHELEIKIAGAVAKSLGTSVDKVVKHLNRVKKAGEIAGKAMKATGIAAGAGFAAVGAGVLAISAKATSSAISLQKAMNDIAAGTMLSKEKLTEYENVLKNVYANNYGESFEDIGEKVKIVTQQLGALDEIEMQNVVQSAYLLQDTFDMEFTESIRGADAMMTQFGIDSQEAFNLMAQGAKNGLNQNGDLADQLAEYSVYYSDLGFSAEEMMNIIAAGAADGAYQIDYLNDAMKEFGIRAIDNSDSTKEAFKELGLNSGAMMKAFAEGGEASKAAFTQVTTALADIDNEVKRNEIGVALFGTKWEDLGESAVLAMTNASGAISSTNDVLSEMEAVKYSDLESMGEGLMRSIEVALLPLGQKLIPVIGDLMSELAPVITDILGAIDFSLISDLAQEILPIISSVISELSPVLQQMLPLLLSNLGEIVSGVLPALLPILKPVLDIIMMLAPILEAIAPCISVLAQVVSVVLVNALESIMPVIEGLIGVLTNLLNYITNIFSGNFNAAFQNLVQVFSGIWSTLKAVFVAPINFIIRGLNGFIGYLNKLQIPDWVPGVGGKGLNFSLIPEIALAEGGIATGPTTALIGEGGEPEVVAPLSKLPTLLNDIDIPKPKSSAGGDGPIYQITFAPVIHYSGNNPDEIPEIMEDEYERFKAFMDEYLHENDRVRL